MPNQNIGIKKALEIECMARDCVAALVTSSGRFFQIFALGKMMTSTAASFKYIAFSLDSAK